MTDLDFQGKTITVASAMKQVGPSTMEGIKPDEVDQELVKRAFYELAVKEAKEKKKE
jgi:hypothetical protein